VYVFKSRANKFLNKKKFPTIGNNNMENAQTLGVEAILLPLSFGI
jgi:hypothetical protein